MTQQGIAFAGSAGETQHGSPTVLAVGTMVPGTSRLRAVVLHNIEGGGSYAAPSGVNLQDPLAFAAGIFTPVDDAKSELFAIDVRGANRLWIGARVKLVDGAQFGTAIPRYRLFAAQFRNCQHPTTCDRISAADLDPASIIRLDGTPDADGAEISGFPITTDIDADNVASLAINHANGQAFGAWSPTSENGWDIRGHDVVFAMPDSSFTTTAGTPAEFRAQVLAFLTN